MQLKQLQCSFLRGDSVDVLTNIHKCQPNKTVYSLVDDIFNYYYKTIL